MCHREQTADLIAIEQLNPSTEYAAEQSSSGHRIIAAAATTTTRTPPKPNPNHGECCRCRCCFCFCKSRCRCRSNANPAPGMSSRADRQAALLSTSCNHHEIQRLKMAAAPDGGHSFGKKTFHKPTYCHHCSDLLWGLIGQGYICDGELSNVIICSVVKIPCKHCLPVFISVCSPQLFPRIDKM